MRLGVVCVHYHAAQLAVQALEALKRDVGGHFEYQMVIVDNGSTSEELELLTGAGYRVLGPGENRGYAAGVNRGASELLPWADGLLVMNPDVIVEPGCIRGLVEAVSSGAAVAGPRFFWDRPGGFQLPPTEPCGRIHELLRVLAAGRGGRFCRWAQTVWRRKARRHWMSEEGLDSFDLSGALLLIQRQAWEGVGPFDDAYRLYFEETDWLQRCRQQGLRARFVGSAAAVHLYAQSTPSEPRTQQWFLESQERFRRRFYGEGFGRLLGAVAGGGIEPPTAESWSRGGLAIHGQARWLEISASNVGFPAAGLRLEPRQIGKVIEPISEALWDQMADGVYYLRQLSSHGRELDIRRVEK